MVMITLLMHDSQILEHLSIDCANYIYIYIYFQVIPGVTLSIITPLNNLLLNLYFENLIIGLYVLYIFNIYANFYINQLLFTIRSINLFFMKYFKLHKLEFKQLIDSMTINL